MDARGGPQFRSILFASHQHIDWLIDGHGADAVMFDLEDMVPIDEKERARVTTAAALADLGTREFGRFVRINAWGSGATLRDLDAIVCEQLSGVALSKAEGPEDVVALDRVLSEIEQERGLLQGNIEIIPLAETASGLYLTREMALASARVKRMYGVLVATKEGDTARGLRLEVNRDGAEWAAVGGHVLLAARSAGVTHIIGATAMEPDNDRRTRELGVRSRTYGANGALCVHPRQVPILNEVFSPSTEDVAHALQILNAISTAVGGGASSIVFDGELATYSHARVALDTIRLAQRFGLDVGPIPHLDIPSYR